MLDFPPDIFTEAAAARARIDAELGAAAAARVSASGGVPCILYGPGDVVPYGMAAEALSLMTAGRLSVEAADVQACLRTYLPWCPSVRNRTYAHVSTEVDCTWMPDCDILPWVLGLPLCILTRLFVTYATGHYRPPTVPCCTSRHRACCSETALLLPSAACAVLRHCAG